jgi:hypothetical protein
MVEFILGALTALGAFLIYGLVMAEGQKQANRHLDVPEDAEPKRWPDDWAERWPDVTPNDSTEKKSAHRSGTTKIVR